MRNNKQTASEWMDQQIAEMERETPELIRWIRTGVRPTNRSVLAAQKLAPKRKRTT